VAHTKEERLAMERDIMQGLESIHRQLVGFHKALPIAIDRLNPHATSTRNLLKVNTLIVELGIEVQKVIRVGVKVKE
jgi:hypothetical protein